MPTTTIENLRHDLAAAGADFAARLDDLVLAAEDLVRLEGELRIAETKASIHAAGPPARELAADMLHGRLGGLRPFVPFVTVDSADRATEALCGEPRR